MPDSLVFLWIIAFVVTNLDDIVLLILFFSHPSFRTRNIVLGEFAGIGSILAISVAGAAGAALVPREWIGVLGFLPLLIGVRLLLADQAPDLLPDTSSAFEPTEGVRSRVTDLPLPTDFLVVWGVTIAHGADNFTLYIPLLREQGLAPLPLIVVVFAVMTVVWCTGGYLASKHPVIGRLIGRYSSWLLPYILFGLGLFILYDNDTLALVSGVLA